MTVLTNSMTFFTPAPGNQSIPGIAPTLLQQTGLRINSFGPMKLHWYIEADTRITEAQWLIAAKLLVPLVDPDDLPLRAVQVDTAGVHLAEKVLIVADDTVEITRVLPEEFWG